MLHAFTIYMGVNMKIQSVYRVNSETVQVIVSMCSKAYAKAKRDGALGALYGIDISNSIYKETGVKAYCPSVNDERNAKGGIKTIVLSYQDSDWAPVPNNVVYVDFVNRRKAA